MFKRLFEVLTLPLVFVLEFVYTVLEFYFVVLLGFVACLEYILMGKCDFSYFLFNKTSLKQRRCWFIDAWRKFF